MTTTSTVTRGPSALPVALPGALPDALPGAHPAHPVADCARCYGDTYGAALTTVIKERQRSGLPIETAALREQAAAYIENALIDPVMCIGHRHVAKLRWTSEQVEYARVLEMLHPDRAVVGVVVDDDKHPIAAAYDCATCRGYARAGYRVIVLRGCPEEGADVEAIQRGCDTRYRMVVPR